MTPEEKRAREIELAWQQHQMLPSQPWTEHRERMLLAQRRICTICGKIMHEGEKLSIDHVVPKSRGGADSKRNAALTHALCNNMKGNAAPTLLERDRHQAALLRLRRQFNTREEFRNYLSTPGAPHAQK